MENQLDEYFDEQQSMQEHTEEINKNNKFNDRLEHTPNYIWELKPDEVIVFGSDLKGHHRGGVAEIAMEKFGAKWGIGKGLSGQSYAIPTFGISLDEIIGYVEEFLHYAQTHDDRLFYVTKIGCGHAGHTINEIAPLFIEARQLDNIRLPYEFLAFLDLNFDFSRDTKAPKAVKLQNYGQVRTLADLAMTLNSQNHYDDPQMLIHDLSMLIALYRERGTVTDDALDCFKAMLEKNAAAWFHDGHFDIDQLYAHLQNEANNDALSAIDLIYSRRANAKIAHIVMLMNEIARYTDPKDLLNDIHSVLLENETQLAENVYINWDDSLSNRYSDRFYEFEVSINRLWARIIDKEGHLDNSRLQKVIFDNHEKQIEKYGLPEVIRRFYEPENSCHVIGLFAPKKEGTGPKYINLYDDKYIKACSEDLSGRSYRYGWYEMQFLLPILQRLCKGENPEYLYTNAVESYEELYLPIRDYSRPIYSRRDRLYFKDEADKKLFLMRSLMEYKANQKNNEQS